MTPDVLLKRSDVTEKWMKGLMSNFDYIMSLNTLAGIHIHITPCNTNVLLTII